MKLMHLSDLHLGKRICGFSMLEDQKHILKEILRIAEEETPDCVLMAGDIYDKPVPPVEAVRLFDDFLAELSQLTPKLFIISGNHDSAERIAFGARLMEHRGVYFSPVYEGCAESVFLEDSYGRVNVFLLPFFKPAQGKRFFPEETIESYTDAVACAVDRMEIDGSCRNVLVTHQFVTGAVRCESEELSVGGSDHVEASVFAPFDYVALGHLHGPQQVGRETIRYCGTPLKYSFSETGHKKSVTLVELLEKGSVSIRTVGLKPLRDMREIRGSYMELTSRSFYEGTDLEDYLHVTLTDEEDISDAVGKLRAIYPNIMRLDYDNARTQRGGGLDTEERPESKTPAQLFADFYEKQNNRPLSQLQAEFMDRLIEELWEEEQ